MKGYLETPKERKIEVTQYNQKRFQGGADGTQEYAPEYDFSALQYILDEIEKAREENWDRTILLTGEEGCGKSTLGGHIASRLGLSDEERVAYTPHDFLEELSRADKGSVVWLDEGARGLYSRDAMTKANKKLTKAFTQIRIKELVSIICLPHKDLLDKNMRDRRIHYWGDVRSRGYRRGFCKWRIAGKRKRKPGEMKIPKHQNEWNISVYWEPLFLMLFPKLVEHNGFNWEKYEEVKKDALEDYLTDQRGEDKAKNVVSNLAAAIQYLKEVEGYEVPKISKIVGLSEPSIYRYLKKAKPEDDIDWSGIE